MKRYSGLLILASVIFLALALSAIAQLGNRRGSLRAPQSMPTTAATARQLGLRQYEDFDIRADHQRSLDAIPSAPSASFSRAEMTNEVERLRQAHPRSIIRWSSLTAAPSRILAETSLTERSNDVPEIVARRFLKQHDGLFRLERAEVDALRVARLDRTAHNGVTHLTLQQQLNGIEVFGARMSIHLTGRGEVFAANGELIPQAARHAKPVNSGLSAVAAMDLAAESIGLKLSRNSAKSELVSGTSQPQTFTRTAELARDVPARLVYFPLAADKLQPAWEFELWPKDASDVYLTIIDAERGSLLYRRNLTSYETDPHGLVFSGDSPRPDNPHRNNNPPVIERQDLPFNGRAIFAANDKHFNWWAGAMPTVLVGNNVAAQLDRDNDNQPDQPTLQIADGNFSFPLDLTKAPTNEDNQKAAQVNLFYWTNRFHDILYAFGFTEAAGNFQTDNFGLGGQGSDAVQADAQDGSGINNANFTTPPDGRAGRVQMFLWSGAPQLDGSLDQTIILHELTHGVSGRLIGDGLGLGGMQARGLGEGWSDYLALALLRQAGDPLDGQYLIAQYATNNYARGLRFFPYSTDIAISPMTFSRIFTNPLPHPVGEIWCATLWDLRALLIKQHGFQIGQQQSIQLVIDGMKLTPVEPTFIEARDAILLADRVNNNGANQCLLWQAFAKRGLGYSASARDVNDRRPVEAFDLPPYCSDLGTLRLDKPNYVNGETIRLTLGDRNAKAPVTVQLSSSMTGDQETITLSPDAVQAGSYQGIIKTLAARKQANDGVLQASVDAGDQIIVTYHDADSSAPVSAQALLVREKTIFEDNVERGNQGWIASGSWAITAAASASATRAWTDSPAGNYQDLSDSSLTSPLFDLTGLSDVTLLFAQRHDLEHRYDYGYVEYSLDDGATWNYAASYTGRQMSFSAAQVSLDALSGQARARFRFRLLSDQTINADGWYLDDIRLVGRSAEAPVIKPGNAPAPFIYGVAPAFGLLPGGTSVIISGANFTDSTDTTVTFDGVSANGVQVISHNTIVATTPPHAEGTVVLRVNNRNGGTSLNQAFTYWSGSAASLAPQLSNIFPTTGSVLGGTTITIYGAGFTPLTTAMLGAQSVMPTFISPNELRVITPAAAAGAVPLSLANGLLTTTRTNAFTYVATTPPRVQLLSPNGGETLYAGSRMAIRWNSSDDRAVSKHRIALLRSDGAVLQTVADDLHGGQQAFVWRVPTLAGSGLRLRVSAIDDEGNEALSLSAAAFQIARRWENVTSLPAPRWQFPVVSNGQSLFAMGGLSAGAGTTVNTMQRFDPISNEWTTLTPMPRAVSSNEAVWLNGKIYVPGGALSSGLVITNHQVYDIANNSWSEVLEAPTSSNFYALAVDTTHGIFYRVAGSANGIARPLPDFLAYDSKANRWTELTDFPEPRFGHKAAFIEGKIYVAGGADRTGGKRGCWVYDPVTDLWSQLANLNRARRFALSAVGSDPAGNPLWFIFGGDDPATGIPLADGEVYDVRNNRWLPLDASFALSAGRTQMAGAVLQGRLYALGGAALSDDGKAYVISDKVEALSVNAIKPVSPDQPPVLAAPESVIAMAGAETIFQVVANDLGSGVALNLHAESLPIAASFTVNQETNNSTRGIFRWTPRAEDIGKSWSLLFTASDGQLEDRRAVTLRVVNAASLAVVNAASYFGGAVAADSIASAFGSRLAPRTEQAQAIPLPYAMAGTSVTVNGQAAPLLYVSPEQVNFVLPAETKPGIASVVVSTAQGHYSLGHITVAASAPAIFTVDANGRGDASAVATADGISYQQSPFTLSVNGRPNYLLLFGTGFRHAVAAAADEDNGVAEAVTVTIAGVPARVSYAGAQGQFVGLDQLNIELPAALATKLSSAPSRMEIVISVNGIEANRTMVWLRLP